VLTIVKKINNNVVLAREREREFIAMGKGIGFGAQPNDELDENLVDKRFFEANKLSANHMAHILSDAKQNEIETVWEIVTLAKENMTRKLNDHFFFTLLDHLTFALERLDQGLNLTCPVEWEVKKFYPKAYEIAKQSLSIIEKNLKIGIPETEAAFLALHFVNAELDGDSNKDIIKITALTRQIITLIEQTYCCKLDSESFFFNRFTTHLRYFLLRQIKGEKLDINSGILLDSLKDKFPKAFNCVNEIERLLFEAKGWHTSDSEKMYIILHLQNLISKIK